MIGKRFFVAVYLLLVAGGLYIHLHRDLSVPINKPLDRFPVSVNQWRMTGESRLSEEVQSVLKATDVLLREYVNTRGEEVTLYIGYHAGGKGSGEIHSPKHCLPGGGWHELSSRRTTIDAAGARLNLVRAVYQKGESSELFMYWFQVRDKSISEEFSLKAAQIVNSALHRRRDASFIRISVPFESDEKKAAAVAQQFVRDFFPTITGFLPR